MDPNYASAGVSQENANNYYSGDDSDEGDNDNDNGGSGNNALGQNQPSGQTPTPEPEKKSAWEAFKDFLGFGGNAEEEEKKVEQAYQNWLQTNPYQRVGELVPKSMWDPTLERQSLLAVNEFRDRLSGLAAEGVDVSKLSKEELDDIYEGVRNEKVEKVYGTASLVLPGGLRQPSEVPSPSELYANGVTPKASEIANWAKSQGWKATRTANGPVKYVDSNGVSRVTIKEGSIRAPGSAKPHVEFKDVTGARVDPFGDSVTRNNPRNHLLIEYDL